MLGLLMVISVIMWYIIDRFKVMFYEDLSWSKYLTTGLALIFSTVLTFTFHLDLFVALEEWTKITHITPIGQVFSILAMTGGSSFVAELVGMFRKD